MDGKHTTLIDSSEMEEKLKRLKPDGACLIVIHGTNLGKKMNLDKDAMIIGRTETADIRIPGNDVSRKHALIMRQGDDFIIEDNNSTNGTFVNTKKTEKTKLHDQDIIIIGNTILKFISDDNLEHAYHEELYQLATMDNLLQIYNKTYFLERLHDEFSRCQRYKRDLSLLVLDVDHFKPINDKYGHQAGDSVLKGIASVIKNNLRIEDILARYGGEEFTIILPETNAEHATVMAERLRAAVENSEFVYRDQEIAVTMSIGVASYQLLVEELHADYHLIEKADQAMYQAKKTGRNRVVCYEVS